MTPAMGGASRPIMMRRFVGRVLAVSTAAAVILGLALAPTAGARGLKTGFNDDSMFMDGSSSVRATWLGRAKSAGAGFARINVSWAGATGPNPPVTPTNPLDPSYDLDHIDAFVKSARAQGLDPVLTVFDAPGWATGKNRPGSVPAGAWKPDPKAFGKFGQALARRYSGNLPGLPRVRYFEGWNEPNLSNFLAPQWKGKKSKGPELYRKLLNNFYSGVHKGQRGAVVVGGTTSPFGDPRNDPLIKGQQRMRPLVFLRQLFCLKRNLKASKCPAKPHMDVLSHHPVNIVNSPKRSAKSPDDVEIADFHKVRSLLKAAERHHHIQPGGNHPLWASEIWWITDPPNRIGISTRKQAKWMELAFYMLWKQGASAVINFEIRDAPYDSKQPPRSQVNSGVYFHSGKKKPALKTFKFPFVTHRKSKRTVGVWGKAPGSGKLQVQRKSKKGWKTVKRLNAKRGKIFQTKIRQRGGADFRGKLGKTKSMPWHQGG